MYILKWACFYKMLWFLFLQIAHFKIPRHVRFMSDFPKTVSGKIQKFQLQKIVLEEKSLGTGWTGFSPQTRGQIGEGPFWKEYSTVHWITFNVVSTFYLQSISPFRISVTHFHFINLNQEIRPSGLLQFRIKCETVKLF